MNKTKSKKNTNKTNASKTNNSKKDREDKEDKDRIIKTLYDELKRKDEWISRIREENTITLKASMRQAERYADLVMRNEKLVKENLRLKSLLAEKTHKENKKSKQE